MYDADFILALFESRLKTLGMSQADLGREAFGKDDNSAMQGLKRGSTPAIDRVEAMAEVLGLECYLGPPRTRLVGLSESEAETDFARPDAARGNYFPIPWHRPGLGPILSPIAFQHQWILDNALIPDRLRTVQPDELHLAGYDVRKSLVVIDTVALRRTSNDLWCYTEKGSTVVARLTFDRGNIVVTRDDPVKPPRLLLEAEISMVTLIGRVVWIGTLG